MLRFPSVLTLDRQFASFLHDLSEGIVLVDSSGSIILTNPALNRMFRYDEGELTGQSIDVLVPEALRHAHDGHRATFMQHPRTRAMGGDMRLLGRRKDGSKVPVEIGLSVSQFPEGIGITAVVTDITTHVRSEERALLQRDVAVLLSQAQSSGEACRQFLQTVCVRLEWDHGGIWAADPSGSALVPVEIWCQTGLGLDRFAEGLRQFRFERGALGVGIAWVTGESRWIDIEKEPESPLRALSMSSGLKTAFLCPVATDDSVFGVMGFATRNRQPRDEYAVELLTAVGSQLAQFLQRKRSEDALRLTEERYRSLFENATFGIYRCTVEGQLLDVNPAMVRMLEYDSPADLKSRSYLDVYLTPGEREMVLGKFLESDQFDVADVRWRTRTGRAIAVRLRGTTRRTPEGVPQWFEVIVEDVSERVRFEEGYRQAAKMEAVGQLASGIAHDFNNLLTVISVDVDMLDDRLKDNPAASELLREIDSTVEKGAALVRRLLTFSRKQEDEIKPVLIDRVIRNASPMLQVLTGESVDLDMVLGCPEATVTADPSQIEQILMNLAVNARDAMPSGGRLTVSTTLTEVTSRAAIPGLTSGPFVLLAVEDTGSGMPAEIQARMFEPFFTTKEVGKGTGLGLFTVYAIVRQYNGTIACESIEGRGTVFRILLPLANAPPPNPRGEHEPAPSPSRGETILLVEDAEGIRRSVRHILEQGGYTVIEAGDGEAALRVGRDFDGPIDLLLTDIGLPRLRGDVLARELVSQRPGLSVLYMSGYSGRGEDQGLEGPYLAKPFKRQALLARIRDVLEGKA